MATLAANNGSWICEPHQNNIKTKGIFYGENPFEFSTPILFAQLTVTTLLTTIFQLFLTPLGESAFFSQMLVGILMGPSFWGAHNPFIRALFPNKSIYVIQPIAFFGCILFLFIVGVRTDLALIRKSGRKAVVIGVLSFCVPITLNTILASFMKSIIEMEPELEKSIVYIASFQSVTSFHVIVCLLSDLKLLNSELGRLATSSALISGICNWTWITVTMTMNQSSEGKQDTQIWMLLCAFCLIILVTYIFRPIMLWMIKQHTGDEKYIKEGYIFGVFTMVLSCAFFGEIIGQHMLFGPMLLGLAVPEGPPLGSALVSKLESFTSIILPCYFVFSGANVNIYTLHLRTVAVVAVLSLTGFIGKLLACVLPSLFCKMPVADAISLGLILTAQGITDVLILQRAMHIYLIDHETFTIMSISMVLLTGITTPIVKFLYNPSRRYITNKKRTIQHMPPDTELRLLACIYSQDETPSIINLLEVSNPTFRSPICFYVIHLQELVGRSAPLLISHNADKKKRIHHIHESDHIIKAFKLYEEQNKGSVVVNLFTAISPYDTMHDEICSLAMERTVSMVIVPFHKQYRTVHDDLAEFSKPLRTVNRQILRNSPCSVGILLDRGTLTGTSSMASKRLYNVGMIFAEGPDDREALAYAMRMGEHPNIGVTVIRLMDTSRKNKKLSFENELDDSIINDFKIANVGKKNHVYKEEFLSDSVGTVAVIRSVENAFDLILVGRRHDNDSPLFQGLKEWNEFPELGFMGDMLAASDSTCQVSVLVVQQQSLGYGKKADTFKKYLFEESCIVVDMHGHSGRVWPSKC